MAQIFIDNKQVPQTHVLIIGVGHYPFLTGGAKQLEQIFPFAKELGQLDSTVVSAKAFCDEVMALRDSDSWIAPLGSVELLTDGIEEANRNNIERAYWDWKRKCKTHKDNVAVFYFAGHGYGMPLEQYLIPADFGSRPENPWSVCIPFSETRAAFHGCEAKTQLFFVDACRSVAVDVLKNTVSTTSLDVISNFQSECVHDLTLLGAAANERAYGLKGGKSYFLEAILNGLRGYGASNAVSECFVSTADFPPNIDKWLFLSQPVDASSQRCKAIVNKPSNFLKLPGHPDAVLEVDCDPELAIPLARFACKSLKISESRSPESSPWKIKVPAGIYQITADFDGGEYKNAFDFKPIVAPGIKQTFKLEKEEENA